METTTPQEQQVKPKTGTEQAAKNFDVGVTPDTPSNRAAAQAGAEALKRKVEKLDAAGTPEPVRKKPEPPTRRTLKQAIDAMDKEIARLEKEYERLVSLRERLEVDIGTVTGTIDAVSRIREEFA